MQRPRLGGVLNKNKTLSYLAVLAVVIAGWLAYRHWHKPNPVANDTTSFMLRENAAAAQDLKNKNYTDALGDYVRAGTAAVSNNDMKQARAIYLEATAKIPDKYIDWRIYDSLYVISNALNDKNLEISSLQKALAKAQQPNSGAGAMTIDFYKSQLKKLGAK